LAIRAAAAKAKRELLRLLACLGIDDHLAYRHPTVVTDVRPLVLVVAGRFFGGWVRVGCARLIHVNTSSVLAAPPGSLDPPAGASLLTTLILSYIIIACKLADIRRAECYRKKTGCRSERPQTR
jgi:hypothetical protein